MAASRHMLTAIIIVTTARLSVSDLPGTSQDFVVDGMLMADTIVAVAREAKEQLPEFIRHLEGQRILPVAPFPVEEHRRLMAGEVSIKSIGMVLGAATSAVSSSGFYAGAISIMGTIAHAVVLLADIEAFIASLPLFFPEEAKLFTDLEKRKNEEAAKLNRVLMSIENDETLSRASEMLDFVVSIFLADTSPTTIEGLMTQHSNLEFSSILMAYAEEDLAIFEEKFRLELDDIQKNLEGIQRDATHAKSQLKKMVDGSHSNFKRKQNEIISTAHASVAPCLVFPAYCPFAYAAAKATAETKLSKLISDLEKEVKAAEVLRDKFDKLGKECGGLVEVCTEVRQTLSSLVTEMVDMAKAYQKCAIPMENVWKKHKSQLDKFKKIAEMERLRGGESSTQRMIDHLNIRLEPSELEELQAVCDKFGDASDRKAELKVAAKRMKEELNMLQDMTEFKDTVGAVSAPRRVSALNESRTLV